VAEIGPAGGNAVGEAAKGSPVSDSWLVQRYRDGHQSAADDLYHRYAGRLRRLAWIKSLRGGGRRLDASDIVQSVFRRFFNAAQRGDYEVPEGEDLWNLLLVITLNKIRSEEEFRRCAKRDVRRTVSVEPGAEGMADKTARDDTAAAFLRACIGEALERLPPDYAAVVQARMEGYEIGEIAERLGRSKRMIERILQESRKRLRDHIGGADS